MSTKRKSATTIAKPVVRQSAKALIKSKIDETRTVVSTGLSSKSTTEPAEIASDTPSQYGSSDDEEGPSDDESKTPNQKHNSADSSRLKRGQSKGSVDAVMQEGADSVDGEPTPPTFGDLVRGNSTIDVPASLAAQAAAAQTSRVEVQQRPTAPVSASSLGTVLNQALRTDDSDLLESCLQTTDVKIIENTISRMDSALAGILLSKLSARMHRRPGRAFGLMRWMQWTLVAHGGALVTQPDLVARLDELSRVLEERSRGLPSLLALKGKLDMLDSQMKFRKSIKVANASRTHRGDEEQSTEEDEDADEPGVVYVEGQEGLGKTLTNGTVGRDAEEDEDDFPAGATVISDSEEESDEEYDEESDEEVAGAESLDEDEVDHNDVEEDEEEESEGEDSRPPAKVRRVSERISKRT